MTDTVAPDTPALGLFARAIGIITSPKATFEKVIAAPRPVGILFLCAILAGGSMAAFALTEKGRQAQVDFSVQQMEKMGMTVTDEVYARLEKQAPYQPYLQMVGSLIGFPIVVLIVTGILYAVFNAIMGGTADFKQVMAVTTHSWVVPTLGALFAGALNFAREIGRAHV